MCNRDAMVTLRANETPEQVSKRKMCNRDAMVTLRGNETPEQVSKREMCNHDAMVISRGNETPEQTSERKKQNQSNMKTSKDCQSQEVSAIQNLNAKFRMASLRATEDVVSSINRITQSRLCMQGTRHKVLSIDEAMLAFHAKIKEGPDYVCTVCHRMMYRVGVVVYSRNKYCNGDPTMMLESVYSFELFAFSISLQ